MTGTQSGWVADRQASCCSTGRSRSPTRTSTDTRPHDHPAVHKLDDRPDRAVPQDQRQRHHTADGQAARTTSSGSTTTPSSWRPRAPMSWPTPRATWSLPRLRAPGLPQPVRADRDRPGRWTSPTPTRRSSRTANNPTQVKTHHAQRLVVSVPDRPAGGVPLLRRRRRPRFDEQHGLLRDPGERPGLEACLQTSPTPRRAPRCR